MASKQTYSLQTTYSLQQCCNDKLSPHLNYSTSTPELLATRVQLPICIDVHVIAHTSLFFRAALTMPEPVNLARDFPVHDQISNALILKVESSRERGNERRQREGERGLGGS